MLKKVQTQVIQLKPKGFTQGIYKVYSGEGVNKNKTKTSTDKLQINRMGKTQADQPDDILTQIKALLLGGKLEETTHMVDIDIDKVYEFKKNHVNLDIDKVQEFKKYMDVDNIKNIIQKHNKMRKMKLKIEKDLAHNSIKKYGNVYM